MVLGPLLLEDALRGVAGPSRGRPRTGQTPNDRTRGLAAVLVAQGVHAVGRVPKVRRLAPALGPASPGLALVVVVAGRGHTADLGRLTARRLLAVAVVTPRPVGTRPFGPPGVVPVVVGTTRPPAVVTRHTGVRLTSAVALPPLLGVPRPVLDVGLGLRQEGPPPRRPTVLAPRVATVDVTVVGGDTADTGLLDVP